MSDNGTTGWTNLTNGTTSTFSIPADQSLVGKFIRLNATSTDPFSGTTAFSSEATDKVRDTQAPSLKAISLSGSVVMLSFSESISATSVPTSFFQVDKVKSGGKVVRQSLSSISVNPQDPTQLLLTLSGRAPKSKVGLRVSYTNTASDQSVGVVEDLAGNDLAPFANQLATTFISSVTVSKLAEQYQNLILSGTNAINGRGNVNANTITGNDASNILNGCLGNDILTGGDGVDIFLFNTTPNSTSNRDLITDFVSGEDKLSFRRKVFSAFGKRASTITPDQLFSGADVTTANNTTQRFLYDTNSGILRYDADGSGTRSSAIEVALLGFTGFHPILSAADFSLS